jgi:2-phosphosulfolactate phosphatase
MSGGPRVELEWGPGGARALAFGCQVIVVVDVLSFTTAVSIAVSRGALVWPYPWAGDDDRAEELAAALGARMVRGRASGAALTLSPVSLLDVPAGARLLMPSPNGSTIAHTAGSYRCRVVAGCLRNATAVATALSGVAAVGLVPAGERWPDGSLRPAYEDLVGAGAIAAMLRGMGADLSPDAAAAAAAASAGPGLAGCPSAEELLDKGFLDDVALAQQRDVDHAVPELRDGCFVAT